MKNQVSAEAKSPVPLRKSLAKILIVMLGAVLILGALATAAYFSLERPAGLTEELMERGLFLSEEKTYIYRDGSFVAIEAEGFQVLEAKQSNGHNAFIAKNVQGVYSLRVDGEVQATSLYPIRGLVLSPEGTKVAYAQQVFGQIGSGAITDWNVIVKDLSEGGETRTYAKSFSPYFVGDGQILRFTSERVVYTDLETAIDVTFVNSPIDNAFVATYQSPNRRVVAWDTLFEGYSSEPVLLIMRLSQISPPESVFLGLNQIRDDTSYALGNDGLYELRRKGQQSEVSIRTFEESDIRKLFSFPADLSVTHLMFQ